jgi:phospholipid/cholesterol/gamma-HCH transport system permease protein
MFTAACTAAYDVAALALTGVRHLPYALRRRSLFARHLYEAGPASLLIVALFGVFVGMILVLYGGQQLARVQQEALIGYTGVAIIWEFGPVFTAFILAGRIGAAYAAEIGTMRVSEEIDALTVMGVHPVAYLVTPRMTACVIMLPALTVLADFVAILAGAGMAWAQLRVPPSVFLDTFVTNTTASEMGRSLLKAAAFGLIIAVVGCYHGFNTTGGAEGVGRSTTRTVVHSLLAILVTDYFLSKLLMRDFNF